MIIGGCKFLDKYCVNCGKIISEEAEFCKYCGAPQSKEARITSSQRKPLLSVNKDTTKKGRKNDKSKKSIIGFAMVALVVIGIIAACVAGAIWIRNKMIK